MPVFLWPNGNFYVVKAANKNQAIEWHDEIGNAGGSLITALEGVHVGFRPQERQRVHIGVGRKGPRKLPLECKSIT
jgi:hypothetical protein